jgi:hypothetical protein
MKYTAYITVMGENGKKGLKMPIEAISEQEAMAYLRSRITVKLIKEDKPDYNENDILDLLTKNINR